MIFESGQEQAEAPFTTALGVFRIALVSFAREVANRDPQLASMAFAAAEAAVQDRLGVGEDQDLTGQDAAIRNAVRHQLRKVLTAAKAAIDAEEGENIDAGG